MLVLQMADYLVGASAQRAEKWYPNTVSQHQTSVNSELASSLTVQS